MERFMSMLGSIDSKTWTIAGVVAVVLALIAILKKAIKLGIFIVIIAVVLMYGGNFIDGFKEKVGIDIVDNTLYIDNEVMGEHNIELAAIENVIIKTGNTAYTAILDITVKGKVQTIEIDNKVLWVLKGVLDKSNINTVDLR